MTGNTVSAFKNYFVPHPGNGHQPHILRRRAVVFALVIMMVAELGFVLESSYLVPRIRLFGLIEASALISETNTERVANGDRALTVSPLLAQAAQDKANDMVANGYFAHTSPSGVTPWAWFEKVGYQFSYAGENLAVNFENSQDVTNAWMNSPEHRANILSTAFTQIGIATAQGIYNGQPAIYVVELFGTPESAPVAFIPPAEAASVSAPAAVPATPFIPSSPSREPSKAYAPSVVASATSRSAGSEQLFVAVKGAETHAVAPSAVKSSGAPSTSAATVPVSQTPAPAPSSFSVSSIVPSQGAVSETLQWLASNPRAVADDFYILLIMIFAAASILNIFVKIKIQFPRLILSGIAVIVIAGLFIVINQGIGVLNAAIV